MLMALQVGANVITPESLYGDKWIVMRSTLSGAVAPAMLDLMQRETEWNAVVVALAGTEQQHTQALPALLLSRMIFLSQPQLKELGFATAAHTNASPDSSPHSANLKNIGYLYAIQHGAKYIYDADELLQPAANLSQLVAPTSLALVAQPVNPYAYFGQPSLWPRGYPLADLGQESSLMSVGEGGPLGLPSVAPPLIRQSLVQGLPDLDAVFLLTRTTRGRPVKVAFVERAPLALTGAAYGPISTLSTLFCYDALWATALPGSSHGPGDLWRGYWSQRLLREMLPAGAPVVSYHSPVAGRTGDMPSPTVLTARMEEESNMYFKTKTLLEFLQAWECPASAPTVAAAGLALARAMASAGFWADNDVALIEAYFADLAMVGYRFPPLPYQAPSDATQSNDEHRNITLARLQVTTGVAGDAQPLATRAWDAVVLETRVDSRWRDALVLNEKKDRIASLAPVAAAVGPAPRRVACAEMAHQTQTMMKSRAPPRVLFVVNFHWTRVATLAVCKNLLENIFAHYFNTPFDVVFVGPGEGSEGVLGNGLPENGYYSYHSLTVAYARYPTYDGYFLINDDALLVQSKFEAERFLWRWYYPFAVGEPGRACQVKPLFPWSWNALSCRQALGAFTEMCGDQFTTQCGGRHALYSGQADMYYVPARLMGRYVSWATVFLKYKVFLEIAVPTILKAIVDMHCASHSVFDEVERDLALPLCTTWDTKKRKVFHQQLLHSQDPRQGQNSPSGQCVAYHPIKLGFVGGQNEILANVSSHFRKQAHTHCRSDLCSVRYARNSDGLLWVATPVAASSP